ncbi:MAG: hypothetical protein CL853_06525 [Crocinitomicaceae bacterium]|nr:hypothetical protein [Crocinitomicaceae bacterium]
MILLNASALKKCHLKKIVASCFFIHFVFFGTCQSANVFLERDFWKKDPGIEKIDSLIALGNDITELNNYKFDPICWAILEKVNNSTIQYLLSIKGNEVNKKTHDGRTYIFWAAYKNNVDLMNYLIEKGANLDIIDSHGYSLMNFSATTGQLNFKIYDICLEQGADINNQFNNDGANPFLLLMPYVKQPNQLTYFLEKGLSINSIDKYGNNAFSYACKTGNLTMMNYLLDKGIDPNANNGNSVIFACKGTRKSSNSIQVFQFLDSLKVNMLAKNQENQNALHLLSYRSKDKGIIDFFVGKGLSVNALDLDGNSPLSNSVKRNTTEMISYFITNGGDVSYIDKKGNTLVHLAVNRSDQEVIQLLHDQSCDLNIYNDDGLTPLHLAVMKSNDDQLIKFLISSGAKQHLKTSFGESVYELAIENELLKEAKVNIEFLK